MNEKSNFNPVSILSTELKLPGNQVSSVLKLLTEGNTVPFIARYRKEATSGLDEEQIRTILERNTYLVELQQRREHILSTIENLGKLTDQLKGNILAVTTKTDLEDLYLPYKPKRSTRASKARERGLEPLAERILLQPATGNPDQEAESFIDPEKDIPDAQTALQGARDIVAEVMSERADIRSLVRETFLETGVLRVEAMPDYRDKPSKYQDYYDYREKIATIASHRFLAIRRGEREEVLRAHIEADQPSLMQQILSLMNLTETSPFASELTFACEDGYHRLLAPGIETDVRVELKMRSDHAAVDVFAKNLRALLLAPPLGGKTVFGVDPGIRTGCKIAAIDTTGKFLENHTVYLSRSDKERTQAKDIIIELSKKHRPAAIAVGNGTGGREAESFIRQLFKEKEIADTSVVQVNEAGASIYSASKLARQEYPDLDLTVRGAISIGLRLQDPLAELVKIEPKSIGVGQYQHDVHQPLLVRKLDEVVESCVNHVGVELNTASAPLLSRVAGIGSSMAKKILEYRNTYGAFQNRQQLLSVSGLGPRTFEQAAGFLRVRESSHPLDRSAVHPERYELVERMASNIRISLSQLVGNSDLVNKIDIQPYISSDVGEPTLQDILAELKKPGRDPRDTYEPIQFRDDVHSISDLEKGMELQGVVTNVTNFGAFVDIGVHRDGLVHISELSDQYVNDPNQVAKAGDRIKVRVLEIDLDRDRIALTSKTEAPREKRITKKRPAPQKSNHQKQPPKTATSAKTLTHNPFTKLINNN